VAGKRSAGDCMIANRQRDQARELAERRYDGHTAHEVLDLLEMLARNGANSSDEARFVARRGHDALRDRLAFLRQIAG
jgi:hypothetical protein